MIRVLVVDDDFRVAGLHAQFAASVEGFEVSAVAHSAAQARARAGEHEPHLLLADVYLPDGSGLDLIRGFAGDAFVLSAADDPSSVSAAFRAGALHYLIKPFTAESLTGRLAGYRAFREGLGGQRVTQEALDAAMHALHGNDAAPARRRSPGTTELVAEALEQADTPRSAAEVAGQLGIARATAQRHLGALADQGTVRVALRYGATGRPEHEYCWAGGHE